MANVTAMTESTAIIATAYLIATPRISPAIDGINRAIPTPAIMYVNGIIGSSACALNDSLNGPRTAM
jgi:hypothetical protein